MKRIKVFNICVNKYYIEGIACLIIAFFYFLSYSSKYFLLNESSIFTMAASFSEYFMSFIHENSIQLAYDQLQKHGLKISEHGFIHYKQRIILKQIVLSLINIAITIGGEILVNYISPLIIK